MTQTEQNVALVTGASRGIGRALAISLGAAGFHIVALARTVGGLEELDDEIRQAGGQAATLVPLDLADLDGIDRLGAALYERWGKLDAFVANAGQLGPVTPVSHITPRDWQNGLEINLTANYRLIRSLDPLLKAAPAGRAVFISSGAARRARAYLGLYAATKAALESLALTYAHEMEATNVRVNVINPGPMRTKMRAELMPGEDPATLPDPSELVPLVQKLVSPKLRLNGHVINFKDWREGNAPLALKR